MGSGRYMTAREAAGELGVSLPTLYAYVSRGMVRSEAVEGGQRSRRYRAEDVRALLERKERRRDPERAAEGALRWGAPVLESGITLVEGGRLFYRGRDVGELAAGSSIEEVAALIWAGDPGEADNIFARHEDLSRPLRETLATLGGLPPAEVFQALLPVAAAWDPVGYDLRPAAVARTGVKILRLMARAVGGDGTGRTAETLGRGWCPGEPDAAALIDAALVYCADHELPVSTFAARCVASARATPYAVVQAGLAALGGVRHGGQVELVEAFLREVETVGDARAVVSGRLRRGDGIPGFGHPLYPEGDPRGAGLLRATVGFHPEIPAVALADTVSEAVLDLTGERPTVDLALATVARALGLPPGGAVALFAVGRTVGWIGHAIEQYASDTLVRPRARYVGLLPSVVAHATP
ncbi:helix-turn-helix domain-containing protein [Rubrobacter tropicus]|uniref:citrate synthase (unknown stereospecificity) n=1 Tax=Rubrobacter tropicus TaxID=2653851 RepID=A0A6G8Q5J8_9ACTN|nr:citrate/2-methylcitrate synthase [Rubrobacter tropicus]QIN81764.1 helix-turn-helix domain-containing protein [Rubrobacter tropicus]